MGGGGTGQEPVAVPVCPRHPTRESYVRCQRCERPTCPECQRPAAVGIQCVDCVRDQNKGMRAPRTVFGGSVATSRDQARPIVTISVIAICLLAFLAQQTSASFTGRFVYAPILTETEPWRMLTSAFLHSPDSFIHILFNMYALWLIGPYLESLFGTVRYLALYLICAFGGSVGYLVLGDVISNRSAYGASGAVFGLFAAYAIVQRKLKRDATMIYALIAINFAIGFLPGWNIAWQAHLGGLLTGAVATGILAYAPRDRRTAIQAGGLVAVLVVLLVLTVVKVQAAGDFTFA
jgi:membrane associated rhomboid family serine protease